MAAAATAAARRAAAAPARTARPETRPATRPGAPARGARSRPRRASGPAARAARPTRGVAHAPARLVPLAVGRTAVAVSDLADSGLVQRLTRGRLWIGALTTLLVGIVALNVLTLSFNASASRVGQEIDTLNRDISGLRARIATNGASNARVQATAARLGLIVPEPGSITYLRPRPGDAALAAKRLSSGELTAGAAYTTPTAPAPAPASITPPPSTVPTSPTIQPAPATPPAASAASAGTTTATSPAPPPAGAPVGGGVTTP